jgi:hypothetical protein
VKSISKPDLVIPEQSQQKTVEPIITSTLNQPLSVKPDSEVASGRNKVSQNTRVTSNSSKAERLRVINGLTVLHNNKKDAKKKKYTLLAGAFVYLMNGNQSGKRVQVKYYSREDREWVTGWVPGDSLRHQNKNKHY